MLLTILWVIKLRMRCVVLVAHMGTKRGADKVLVGRLEGKRSFERPRCRWGYNITVDQKWDGGMDWFDLAQVVDSCAWNNEPLGSIKCGKFLY
jgi:hypothetical protein